MTEPAQRRLAAILAADVVGYSRLMGENEAGTLAALRQLRAEQFGPMVGAHRGEVVKSMGDGWLVSFDSAADAVTCAIALQQALAGHAIIKLRAAVHVGDITRADEDLYGDGVNIAARLQEIAAPGAVVISDTVRRAIDGTLAAGFAELGQQDLKNISEPVTAFGWGMSEVTKAADTAPNTGPLADKPSIAVLPFDNMSGDLEQEYFSDGVAEDIITAQSKYRWFTVTARNSTFTYKGTAVNIQQVGKDLNVRYVLEGSVRRAGNRVRVTAQLIDTASGNHVWADHFDGELDDIFRLQDEITQQIVTIVAPEIEEAEMFSAARKETVDLNAYERVMRARWHLYKYNRKDVETAEQILLALLSHSPQNAEAQSLLATCHMYKMVNAWCEDPVAEIDAADAAARQAVSLDSNDAFAHVILGLTALFTRKFHDSLDYLNSAININPNLAAAYGIMATTYGCMGECGKSLQAFEAARSLSPRDPTQLLWMSGIGIGLIIDRRYDDAVENCRNMMRIDLNYGPAHRQLCSALALADRLDEARQAMRTLLQNMPELTVSKVGKMIPVMNPDDNARWLEGLRLAGLPE